MNTEALLAEMLDAIQHRHWLDDLAADGEHVTTDALRSAEERIRAAELQVMRARVAA